MAAASGVAASPAVLRPWTKTNRTSSAWKRHIIRQLKHRDRTQKYVYQDLIASYNKLLEKSKLLGPLNERLQTEIQNIQSSLLPRLDVSSVADPVERQQALQLHHRKQVAELQKKNGELAVLICELNESLESKVRKLDVQQSRIAEVEGQVSELEEKSQELHDLISKMKQDNCTVKERYDKLLEEHRAKDETLRKITEEGSQLIGSMVKMKSIVAESENEHNERLQQEKLDKELANATSFTINPKKPKGCSEDIVKKNEAPNVLARTFRSASATFLRPLLSSLKENFVFGKSRGSSFHDDFHVPIGICWSSRLPAKALDVLKAHDSEINAVKFSPISRTLATGGADRIIKLWNVVSGKLEGRTVLEGSSSGITSIEFDPSGHHILAASYNRAVQLWQVDNSCPKDILTGHMRKVTAAKFRSCYQQAVTGSFDRTVKIWDLHKGACVRTIQVPSYCSDVVCSEYFIISGHHDKKIRFWDCRMGMCTNEIPVDGKVTSLNISCDQTQLLSCSRDDTLKVIDLRKMSDYRQTFRAEGFKCGSDFTKSIFSPDGNFVTAGSADGTLFIWNTLTGKLETSLTGEHSSTVNAVAWSLSGEYVVSVDRGTKAVLWSDY